jgi:hypothetical protein
MSTLEVESRITEVTLYARGARVRRVATISLGSSAPRARLAGLPAAVIDDTVRTFAEGGAVVTAVHVGLDAPGSDAAAAEATPEVRAGQRRVALAEAEVERLDAALTILAAAPVALPPPKSDEPQPAWSAMVDARRALVTVRTERELALRDQAAAARRAADEARRVLAAAVDRDRRAGSARAAKLHELRKHVELELDGTGTATVYLEYQVAAARWAPSYVARLTGEQVVFELRATVAQDTGEDWTGVALRLSTAEPERFGALPELAAQRIGRRQSEPARPGFRAPPVGAGALYQDYLRAFPDGDPSNRGGRPAELTDQVWDEESSRAKQAFVMPPGGPPMQGGRPGPRGRAGTAPMPPPPPAPPPPASAPAPQPMAAPAQAVFGMAQSAGYVASLAAPAPQRSSARSEGGGGAAGADGAGHLGASSPPEPPVVLPPARLDYANLRMAPPGAPDRGTLVAAPRDRRMGALEAEVALAVGRVSSLALPSGCSADWPHTYDYAFATDGTIDVRADGGWHSIAVTAKPSTAKLRHVAVPRKEANVFRLAAIENPLAGPLLPGPIDVYDRGTFLITSAVEQTPPGATVEVGLGVDAAVKLSRNTEFREEATGVLRGGLRLHHAIKIDVDNLSDRAIELEIRERVPVTREGDDDVEVTVARVEPAWERWTPDPEAPRERRLRGGYRWRLSVPPGAKRSLRAAYDVKIAGKLELVGGNRRES